MDTAMEYLLAAEDVIKTYTNHPSSDTQAGVDFIRGSTLFLSISAVLYLVLLPLGLRLMRNRPAFELQTPLVLWNLGLAVFSLLVFLNVLPLVIRGIALFGVGGHVCNTGAGYFRDDPRGMWAILFAWSKIVEWGDTAFLVLRKRRVIFLHWVHHILTMLYCWYGTYVSATTNTTPYYFVTMNAFVHVVMYSYYFMSALKIRFMFPVIITILQLMQMVAGLIILTFAAQCDSFESFHGFWLVSTGFAMYGLYFTLFLLFFVGRFLPSSKPRKAAKSSHDSSAEGKEADASSGKSHKAKTA